MPERGVLTTVNGSQVTPSALAVHCTSPTADLSQAKFRLTAGTSPVFWKVRVTGAL